MAPNNCLFCEIVNRTRASHTVWEDEDFVAFLDINPVNAGHILLVPRQHILYVFNLPEPLYSRLFQAAKMLAAPLRSAMNAQRIGVVIEGFGVPHLHLHLVPINSGNELHPQRAAPATPADLENIAGRIRRHLKEL